MIDGAYAVSEGGDRFVVGDVDDLGADMTAGVGADEFCLIASGHDDQRAFRLRQQSNCPPYPAAAPDHHDGLVPQRVTHRQILLWPGRRSKLGWLAQNISNPGHVAIPGCGHCCAPTVLVHTGSYNPELPKGCVMPAVHHRYATIDGHRLFYREAG